MKRINKELTTYLGPKEDWGLVLVILGMTIFLVLVSVGILVFMIMG